MHDRVEGFTELERDLIGRIHRRYGSWGFPSLEAFNSVSREHTGAGRYTHVIHEGEFPYDGAADLWADDPSVFEMAGWSFQFWAFVDTRKVRHLEIVSLGLRDWDGSETDWQFVEPEAAAPVTARK